MLIRILLLTIELLFNPFKALWEKELLQSQLGRSKVNVSDKFQETLNFHRETKESGEVKNNLEKLCIV